MYIHIFALALAFAFASAIAGIFYLLLFSASVGRASGRGIQKLSKTLLQAETKFARHCGTVSWPYK